MKKENLRVDLSKKSLIKYYKEQIKILKRKLKTKNELKKNLIQVYIKTYEYLTYAVKTNELISGPEPIKKNKNNGGKNVRRNDNGNSSQILQREINRK